MSQSHWVNFQSQLRLWSLICDCMEGSSTRSHRLLGGTFLLLLLFFKIFHLCPFETTKGSIFVLNKYKWMRLVYASWKNCKAHSISWKLVFGKISLKFRFLLHNFSRLSITPKKLSNHILNRMGCVYAMKLVSKPLLNLRAQFDPSKFGNIYFLPRTTWF